MLSLEYIDFVSGVGWGIYEKVSIFQQKFWLTMPVHWDSTNKKASHKTLRECFPLLVVSLLQIPTVIYSWLILLWQSNPATTEPRFRFTGVVLIAFASVMNFFITIGSLSNIYKRRDWSAILSMVGQYQFLEAHKKSTFGSQNNLKWAKKRIYKDITLKNIIIEGTFVLLLFLGSSGFIIPMIQDGCPICYFFISVQPGSFNYKILKYLVRPLCWGIWSMYCVWTFFGTVIEIFFLILHGCLRAPRVPKLSARDRVTVVENSFANFTAIQCLTLKLMESAYREYRQFQIFIRPANEAMYIVIPDGLCGLAIVNMICGVVTIKGHATFPINLYVIFPCIFLMDTLLIFVMVPIACNVFESAVKFKEYWLGRIRRTEARKRLVACRPMGIAAGPFGYVQRALPMEMMNGIVDYICSAIVTFDFNVPF